MPIQSESAFARRIGDGYNYCLQGGGVISSPNIMSAAEAAALIKSGSTVCTAGFLSYCMPETLYRAVERRFLKNGTPKDLTLVCCAGQSLKNGCGVDHFAHVGLVRRVISGHWNLQPALAALAASGQIEAYNLPQGIMARLLREIAAHGPGILSQTGLRTFVDPRVEGGRVNSLTTEDLVGCVVLDGREWLLYKAFPIDIALIRGSYCDEAGNISFEREALSVDACAAAQAAHNSGGKVIVQVEKIVPNGRLDPWKVKIPGCIVDAIVLAESAQEQAQCYGYEYNGALTGDGFEALRETKRSPLDIRKIIGRRAAMELHRAAVVNLGIGMPEQVASVASEEGIFEKITLTVESGAIGGLPCGGDRFGGSVNVTAILDQASQFDFYDGGGVDLAFLGMAQADSLGNVNVSRFGGRIAGCGGFIDITQNAAKVIFCGSFTAGGIDVKVEDGRLKIASEGRRRKFLQRVEQITYCAAQAEANGHETMYVTERAVFRLHEGKLVLCEVAPGIDLETQVLQLMDFRPEISDSLRLMDGRIFSDAPMGLKL